MRLGNALLFRGSLDPVLREIAIIRVGRLSKATYELFQHERIGCRAGISEARLAGLRHDDHLAFGDVEKPGCASSTRW